MSSERIKGDGVLAWNLDTRCEHSPLGCGNDVAIGYTTGLATEKHAACWSRSLFGWEETLLNQSDIPLHSGLSFWPAYVRFLQEEPVIEETVHAERSGYGYFLQITCMTLYENHLACWHLLKVTLLPEHRNANYQSSSMIGARLDGSLSQSASATCSIQPLLTWE
jgi:hypothetical protein